MLEFRLKNGSLYSGCQFTLFLCRYYFGCEHTEMNLGLAFMIFKCLLTFLRKPQLLNMILSSLTTEIATDLPLPLNLAQGARNFREDESLR